ncbi:hypothetical protein CAL7716_058730 [Calothrix sp. PCC 7716]|nr:hypothetical protein CAL7716_058730 [Calothrix sp. PCC 7716]
MIRKQKMRRKKSVTDELLYKSREAALASVQIFNNPQIYFKSEIFIVIIIIAWTYLLHAFYRKNKIDYRYYKKQGNRKKYERTKAGAYKHWELERCLNETNCPVDKDTSNNLRFLIFLRHEIEHQMTSRIDNYLSARFQACCLNFNYYIKLLFGENQGIDKHLGFSLQLSTITEYQSDALTKAEELPKHIQRFIEGFDGELSENEFNSSKFAYRVFFVAKTANKKGHADQVIEFIKADSPLAENINKTYTVIKETERPKYLPKDVVKIMQKEGFLRFSMNEHTKLWKEMDAKSLSKGFGVQVVNTWYWYESWIQEVRKYCERFREQYK